MIFWGGCWNLHKISFCYFYIVFLYSGLVPVFSTPAFSPPATAVLGLTITHWPLGLAPMLSIQNPRQKSINYVTQRLLLNRGTMLLSTSVTMGLMVTLQVFHSHRIQALKVFLMQLAETLWQATFFLRASLPRLLGGGGVGWGLEVGREWRGQMLV